jgi:primase-polymerase (primpol)-like protein
MPKELKKINRWVVWAGEKLPYQPKAKNMMANVNDEKTWGTYEEAFTAYKTGKFNGIGFVLTGDGIAGVDIDDCIINGEVTEDALDLLNEIGCSYVEYSPSGKGLRGFGYALNQKGRRGYFRTSKIELYTSKRYLTVTGQVFKNGPLLQLSGYESIHAQITSSEATGIPPNL